MPEHKFRALRYLAIDEIESAVQIVAMANDSHGMSGILRRAAAAHVVADLGRLEKPIRSSISLGEQLPR